MPAHELPDLGAGVIWFAGLDPMIEAGGQLVDFLEIEPATVALSADSSEVSGPLAALARDPRPTVVHGVSAPLGGTIAPTDHELRALATAAHVVESPWVSEHLSVDRLTDQRGETIATGFFLPPSQTPAGVEIAAERLRSLRQATGRPVAFETGVNYLRAQPGELSDGEFWAAVAEAADCFILCDLHNLWCNEQNGRQPLADVIDSLPLERVCEIHLAGGQPYDGFLLDAHSDVVDPALMAQASSVVERLPSLRAITFELTPDYVPQAGIDSSVYRGQLEQLQRLWDRRGTKTRRSSRRVAPTISGKARWTPESWEESLCAGLNRLPTELDSDPGIAVYRHLIDTMRAGAIVTALPLSYRLIALTAGVDRADQILDTYRRRYPASAWARDEAQGFALFLDSEVKDVPFLGDVVRFELAAHEVMIEGHATEVSFGCEPGPLLDALRRGVRPPELVPAAHRVCISP